MSTIIVSGGGVQAPTECCHGKCMFACIAAYRTGLICMAMNQYVEPGPVPPSCPVVAVPATIEKIQKLLELDSKMEDDRK